jgi:hypothetical protein
VRKRAKETLRQVARTRRWDIVGCSLFGFVEGSNRSPRIPSSTPALSIRGRIKGVQLIPSNWLPSARTRVSARKGQGQVYLRRRVTKQRTDARDLDSTPTPPLTPRPMATLVPFLRRSTPPKSCCHLPKTNASQVPPKSTSACTVTALTSTNVQSSRVTLAIILFPLFTQIDSHPHQIFRFQRLLPTCFIEIGTSPFKDTVSSAF